MFLCCGCERNRSLVNDTSSGYISGYKLEVELDSTSQQRALRNYRARLGERGLVRFEVLGRSADRALVRALARRLADDGPEAATLRATVSGAITGESSRKGGILAALRRSPLVGADLNLTRPRVAERDIDL